MALEFTVDPELTDELRAEIVACWTDVSNAGGSVGFVPPVAMDDVHPVAEKDLARVAAGRSRLIVGWETSAPALPASAQPAPASGSAVSARPIPTPTSGASASARPASGQLAPGRLAAIAFISGDQFRLTEHWRTVKRVMVHPDFQGRGYGVLLMAEVERTARKMGLEMLTLDCRGGTGNDQFYKKCGYVEYGRLPGALRLGPDDYREQIMMSLTLQP
jgi:GNAT superfamily N-acetyltransferase